MLLLAPACALCAIALSCCVGFGCGLAAVVPGADGLEVAAVVVVSGDDVVDLSGSVVAACSVSHQGFASIACVVEYGGSDGVPVGWESGCSVGVLPSGWHMHPRGDCSGGVGFRL